MLKSGLCAGFYAFAGGGLATGSKSSVMEWGPLNPKDVALLGSKVGDIRRFCSARELHSYLGVVPTVRSSGGITHSGAINRRSRKLSRTLFTQAAIHFVDSSPSLERFYRELVERKGHGRARIALLRKVFSMMRRMLLAGEVYRWTEQKLYQKKLKDYTKKIKKENEEVA